MGFVPHSGNKCSGLCRSATEYVDGAGFTACSNEHPDCWQCADSRQALADRKAAMSIMRNKGERAVLASNLSKKEAQEEIERLRTAIGLPEKPAKGKSTIAILDELAAQPNDLNGDFDKLVQKKLQHELERQLIHGAPVGGIPSPTPPPWVGNPAAGKTVGSVFGGARQTAKQRDEGGTVQITRAALEGLVAQTGGKVVMDWNNGDPVFRDGNGQNMTAADMPATVGPTKANAIKRLVRDAVTGKDGNARAALKAKGATDEDIAAAERILRLAPSKPKMSFMGIDLDSELAQISGLHDLLMGVAPASVMASGKAINNLIADYKTRVD